MKPSVGSAVENSCMRVPFKVMTISSYNACRNVTLQLAKKQEAKNCAFSRAELEK